MNSSDPMTNKELVVLYVEDNLDRIEDLES